VPPEPIRQLRDLTRARTAITRERGREAQRLEKLLEDAGIKLSAVASDILGVSGRAMLEALIAGDDDPAALADLAKRRLRSKIPALGRGVDRPVHHHHAFLARVHLDVIDRHTAAINKLTARIEVMIEPIQGFRDLICTIPGISTLTADVLVAETGADMSRFPTAKHLASWAGFEVMLVNARHVKTLPGRKTDVADATWLAQLGAHGLVVGNRPAANVRLRYGPAAACQPDSSTPVERVTRRSATSRRAAPMTYALRVPSASHRSSTSSSPGARAKAEAEVSSTASA